jgi:hypothetical protein
MRTLFECWLVLGSQIMFVALIGLLIAAGLAEIIDAHERRSLRPIRVRRSYWRR